MASPIQIVLNPENYEEAREAGGGGGRKDFSPTEMRSSRPTALPSLHNSKPCPARLQRKPRATSAM